MNNADTTQATGGMRSLFGAYAPAALCQVPIRDDFILIAFVMGAYAPVSID